jgi:hypothetical protein
LSHILDRRQSLKQSAIILSERLICLYNSKYFLCSDLSFSFRIVFDRSLILPQTVASISGSIFFKYFQSFSGILAANIRFCSSLSIGIGVKSHLKPLWR